MKKARFCAVLVLLTVCVTSFAQFTNSSSVSSSASGNDEWGTFWLEWNPSSLKPSKGDSQSFTGLSAGFSHAFSLSSGSPLFLEGGLGIQYSFYSVDGDDYYDDEMSIKVNWLSLKVPVNFVYRYNLPNSNISLCPFAGVTLRFNLSGKMKYEYEGYDYEGYDYEEDEYYDDSEELDLFDKDDMGSKDATWKRFQIGWQIGAKALFNNKVTLGVSYGSDFSEIVKKTKINTTTVSLGFIF